MIKGAIFDLDGTLANTLETIAYFANNALSENGFKRLETDRYRFLVGKGAKRLVEGMLFEASSGSFDKNDKDNDNYNETFLSVYNKYNKSYDDNFLYKTKPYDGILLMLEAMSKNGMKLAVLSNKPDDTTQKIVSALFSPYISACYGKREDMPRKPDPTAALLLSEQLAVKREECIYVGDTATDMETGKRAGFFTIGVEWGFRDRAELIKSGADLTVKSPNEILSYCNIT